MSAIHSGAIGSAGPAARRTIADVNAPASHAPAATRRPCRRAWGAPERRRHTGKEGCTPDCGRVQQDQRELLGQTRRAHRMQTRNAADRGSCRRRHVAAWTSYAQSSPPVAIPASRYPVATTPAAPGVHASTGGRGRANRRRSIRSSISHTTAAIVSVVRSRSNGVGSFGGASGASAKYRTPRAMISTSTRAAVAPGRSPCRGSCRAGRSADRRRAAA